MTARDRFRLGPLGAMPIAVVLCLVTACIVKKPPTAAEIRPQAMPAVDVPQAWTGGDAGTAVAVADDWLATFQDVQLNAAVTQALVNNADLRVAAARVEQARRYAQLAGAKLYPSADLLARGGGKLSGDGSGLQGAVLSITWELDVWGRVRYGRAAAAADAASTVADYEFARQSIAALVAKNWFLATEAHLQAELARATIQEHDHLVRLASTRSRIGVGNDEDFYVARVSLGMAQDTLRQVNLAEEQAVRGLEVLMGRYPAATLAIPARLPQQPTAIPAGLPSDLLERRPDVIAAERRIAAAFHRVHEAKAARLPAIGLTTGVSSISSDLFELKDRDNPVWSAGANLLMPIFRGGALRTQVQIRTAEQQQAVAAYASIGLRAFGEVENALAAETAAREREQILAQTLADARRALQIVQAQYKVGSTDLRFVTQRQLATSATESALIRVQAEQRVQRVNVHLALGGSFAPRPPGPAQTQ